LVHLLGELPGRVVLAGVLTAHLVLHVSVQRVVPKLLLFREREIHVRSFHSRPGTTSTSGSTSPRPSLVRASSPRAAGKAGSRRRPSRTETAATVVAATNVHHAAWYEASPITAPIAAGPMTPPMKNTVCTTPDAAATAPG